MKQYSNLDVYGKIKQKNGTDGVGEQGTESNDVVLYPTLTTRVPAQLPSPQNVAAGQAILTDGSNGYTLGLAGAVDDVQINGSTILDNRIANIPIATPSNLGVVTLIRGSSDTTHTVPTQTKMEQYVAAQIEAMPEPMIFKGTLGTGGTIGTLPAATASNEGWTYKVITAGTYAGQAAKVGDVFICANTGTAGSPSYSWTYVPSGDEPIGTVTTVTPGVGLTTVSLDPGNDGSPITGSGTIKVNLNSETSIGAISSTNKIYAVGVASNSKLAVAVPWTDTKVTQAGNHYSPSTDNDSTLTANASGATAEWSIDVVKGITVTRDTKGHVTGMSVTSGKIPANPNTDSKVKQTEIGSSQADASFPLLASDHNVSTIVSGTEYFSNYSATCYIKGGKLYSNGAEVLTSVPVTSVNGETGDVQLDAMDVVGYVPLNSVFAQVPAAGNTAKSYGLIFGDTGAAAGSEPTTAYYRDTIYLSVSKVSNTEVLNLVVPQINGYTLGAACAKGVDTSISSTSSTNLPTSAAVASYVASNDLKVKQTVQSSTTTTYPILMSAQTSPTSGTAYESKYSTVCYLKSNELYSNNNYCWTSVHSPFATTDVAITES